MLNQLRIIDWCLFSSNHIKPTFCHFLSDQTLHSACISNYRQSVKAEIPISIIYAKWATFFFSIIRNNCSYHSHLGLFRLWVCALLLVQKSLQNGTYFSTETDISRICSEGIPHYCCPAVPRKKPFVISGLASQMSPALSWLIFMSSSMG